jgi:hypothetical protein
MVEDPAFPEMMAANEARKRFGLHQTRLARDETERNSALAERERTALSRKAAG